MSFRALNMSQAADIPKGGSNYFTLPDDKDSAVIRFLYESFDDIPIYAIHDVQDNGNRMVVGCLRQPTEPLSVCPLCASNNRPKYTCYLNVAVEDSEGNLDVQVWNRSLAWVEKNVKPYFEKYGSMTGVPMEVVRNGKKGDMQTTYNFFPLPQDNETLASLDLDLIDVIEDEMIRVWDVSDMTNYVNHGVVPQSQEQQQSMAAPTQGRNPRTAAAGTQGRRTRGGTGRTF